MFASSSGVIARIISSSDNGFFRFGKDLILGLEKSMTERDLF